MPRCKKVTIPIRAEEYEMLRAAAQRRERPMSVLVAETLLQQIPLLARMGPMRVPYAPWRSPQVCPRLPLEAWKYLRQQAFQRDVPKARLAYALLKPQLTRWAAEEMAKTKSPSRPAQ